MTLEERREKLTEELRQQQVQVMQLQQAQARAQQIEQQIVGALALLEQIIREARNERTSVGDGVSRSASPLLGHTSQGAG